MRDSFVSLLLQVRIILESRFLDLDVVLGFEIVGLVAVGTTSGKLFNCVFFPPIKCSEHTLWYFEGSQMSATHEVYPFFTQFLFPTGKLYQLKFLSVLKYWFILGLHMPSTRFSRFHFCLLFTCHYTSFSIVFILNRLHTRARVFKKIRVRFTLK